MSTSPIDEILHARSISVVGATRTGEWGGGGFVASLLEFGYTGKVYPVNPKYPEIQGLVSYPSLRDIPGPVDYVISSVPAKEVIKLLEDAAYKGVRNVHLFTARLAETGRPDAIALERAILQLAKAAGIRIIGPNCMGVYCPSARIAFHSDFPKEPGPVGLVSQSGMLARELVHAGPRRGIHFSKVISYGNAIDINECDLLEFMIDDPETRVILMYIEGVKQGRRFFEVLKRATAAKPVIILKGGWGEAGARATASHTASLAGGTRVWNTMVEQAGAATADSAEELIDLAAAFTFLPPVAGKRVGVVAVGGGASVLAADQCERARLDVIPLPDGFRAELKRQNISIWDWLSNPADFSIREDDRLSVGLILEMMAKDPHFDLLISLMGFAGRPPGMPGMPLEEALEQQYRLSACQPKPFLAVVTEYGARSIEELGGREMKGASEVRAVLLKRGIPFFATVSRAALAARKVADYYAGRAKRR